MTNAKRGQKQTWIIMIGLAVSVVLISASTVTTLRRAQAQGIVKEPIDNAPWRYPFGTWPHTADPTARVFNNRLYVYTSVDSPNACKGGGGASDFCMEKYRVYSTSDMKNWTSHGDILNQLNVPWDKDGSTMWAPDVAEHNGKYYLFFPSDFKIGVAVSDSPVGPFEVWPTPITGGIDPNIYKSPNGSLYLFWARNRGIAGQKIAIDPANKRAVLQDSPKDFGLTNGDYKEGPFVYDRSGKLYLTFAMASTGGYRLAYAIGNPYNPLQEPTPPLREIVRPFSTVFTGSFGTNHGSVVNFRGKNYVFFHRHLPESTRIKNRAVLAQEIFYNADGTIQPIVPKRSGLGFDTVVN